MAKQKLKTTAKQTAANRRNAQKSTGPITPAGKDKASRNALKHGLLAREVIIDAGEGAENPEEFNAVLLDLYQQFDPQGLLEEMLVEKIAVAYWRLRRAHRYEVGLIRSKLDRATDQYYAPDPLGIEAPKSSNTSMDAQLSGAQELRQEWLSDKAHLEKMREANEDLQAIYDWEDNWDWLHDQVVKMVDEEWVNEISNESPASLHESLRKAGWSDDAIWQGHINVCVEQIEAQTQAIAQLQKEKETNRLAVQVDKKLGSIPDAAGLNRLLRYETAIERQFYKAIDQLERLQRIRAGHLVPAPVNIDVALTGTDPQ